VIVAVAVVRVMKVAIDDVVRVIAVRDSVVPTSGPVDVGIVVAPARMRRRAVGGVRAADGEAVLIDVIAMRMMEMSVVEIVLVPIVLDLFVTASGAVLVLVIVVLLVVVAHRVSSSPVSFAR
jgi:hypothetical protein